MSFSVRPFLPLVFLGFAFCGWAQPYFHATASISGNTIFFKIKPVNSNITCGWSDIEFFFRNGTANPAAHTAFSNAIITVNTTHFPGVNIPYNGMNIQGDEVNYNVYWFGLSFTNTAPQTNNQNQEYTVCTITLSVPAAAFALELCHNEPNFSPHYLALTDEGGNDKSNLSGTCKFYGPGATICEPTNCPGSTPGNNHILPLNGAVPVELLDFQVWKHDEHTARLGWQTASERNTEAFEIERQNGFGWLTIGVENAKIGNGGGAVYQYFDREVPEGLLYFRLKIRDTAGSVSYSPVRSVRFGAEPFLRIFPNPTTDYLQLEYGDGLTEGPLQIELLDWAGRGVARQNLEAEPGATGRLVLAPFHLPAGAYVFRAVSANNQIHTEPLVIGRQ